jgi:hypothetical protein
MYLVYPENLNIFSFYRKSEFFADMYDTQYRKINRKKIVSTQGDPSCALYP